MFDAQRSAFRTKRNLLGNGFEEDTQNEPILLSIPLYHTPDE
eukprot:gene37422-46167_t